MSAQSLSQSNYPPMQPTTGWITWRNWTLATTLGELVGFLAPALAGVLVVRFISSQDGLAAALLMFIVLVAAGSIEGAVLGFAQWLALRRALPAIAWQHWVTATALAAVIAWTLGMLPNTLVDAAGLGTTALIAIWIIVAPGILLSIGIAQWRILNRHISRAGLWAPANAVAWTLGVAMTFIGASLIDETMPIALAVAIGVGSGVLMGLIVGAITGLALVYLLRHNMENRV